MNSRRVSQRRVREYPCSAAVFDADVSVADLACSRLWFVRRLFDAMIGGACIFRG